MLEGGYRVLEMETTASDVCAQALLQNESPSDTHAQHASPLHSQAVHRTPVGQTAAAGTRRLFPKHGTQAQRGASLSVSEGQHFWAQTCEAVHSLLQQQLQFGGSGMTRILHEGA